MKKAFTIIEVVVAIGIFVILLSVVILDYGYTRRINEFRLTAYDIEDSIGFTKNLSLTGQKIQNTVPINGYGIIFLKDVNGSYSYNIYADIGVYGFYNENLIYSENILESQFYFDQLRCKIKDESELGYEEKELESLDINFSMPKGLMSIIIDENKDENVLSCQIFLGSTKAPGKWVINITPGSGKTWSEFLNN
ncbi:MAG TPA: type II secretion system protein [bacterium]|jgi:prepilin-type N-terminal cleavage/methylation domain-containing protein|nr:type II secretion system protein [bacterium]HOG37970.1 type II secretion system protein [bacterium]HQI03029.1 type II secretion system protein [bacterium]